MAENSVAKFNTVIKPTWCPGCGNYGIWNAMKMALFELGLEPHEIFVVYDIGCFGNGANFLKTYVCHSLHGRTVPVAMGAKLGNKELKVIAMSGDGGAYGEGIQHLIHAARYNVDITYIVADNQRFSLTTGQASPITKKGIITKTTPFGEIKEPVNPILLSLNAGASMVARGFAGDQKHLAEIIKKAIEHKGFSHIDILQPCVSFNKENTAEWYREVIYKLDEHKYNSSDKESALIKVEEFEKTGKMPIGIIYEEKKKTYEDQIPQLKDEPLFEKSLEEINCFE